MSLEDIKKERFLFLQKLYNATDGNTLNMIIKWNLGSELGYNELKINNIVNYLSDEGLVKHRTKDGHISITHDGIIEIEESLSNPDASTQHFPAINVIHIENMNGSSIQQGTNHSTQTVIFNTDKSPDLEKIVDEIEKIKTQIILDRLVINELISEIDTVKSQLKSPKPKNIIIMESLKTIRNILEGVAGNATTPMIIEMINNIIK